MSAQQIVSSGNSHFVIGKLPIEEYNFRTRFTDHNIGVALLFNFYHGIELSIKGHLLGLTHRPAKGHKLTDLMAKLANSGCTNSLVGALDPWLSPNEATVMGKFLSANKLQIDQWYEALKYADLCNSKVVSHFDLKYGGHETLDFWNSISEASEKILKLSVEMSRDRGYAKLNELG